MLAGFEQNKLEPKWSGYERPPRSLLAHLRLPLLGLVALVILAGVAFLVVQAERGGVEPTQLPVIEIGLVLSVPGDSGGGPGGSGVGQGGTGSGSIGSPTTLSSPETTISPTGDTPTTGATSTTSGQESPATTGSTMRETIPGGVRSGTTSTGTTSTSTTSPATTSTTTTTGGGR